MKLLSREPGKEMRRDDDGNSGCCMAKVAADALPCAGDASTTAVHLLLTLVELVTSNFATAELAAVLEGGDYR
jgi:hypothetical protein